ncbi:hypothetical protein F5Y05DRAFT_163246 [Hypoxylon sp. FL0543]|nr:hypothetical protein F5Y05DRAFT_163246 [Hypoxylon sp. FL0543]
MAELALAIVPLCIGAIKGAVVVRKKMKVFCHSDRVFKRLRKRFTTQTSIFLDECQLLLQEILDPNEAQAMMESLEHPGWNSKHVDTQIKDFLGRRYEDFMETVEEIKDHIQSLDVSLDNAGSNGELSVKLKRSERVGEKFEITAKVSDYESTIGSFKEANQELKRLRKTACKMLHPPNRKVGTFRRKPLPHSYRLVAHHSSSFYKALSKFWTCLQSHHTNHDVRLLLHSRGDGSLRVLMRYRTQVGFQTQHQFLDLVIRSQSLHLIHLSVPAYNEPETSGSGERPKKIRKVRFSDDAGRSAEGTPSRDSSSSSKACISAPNLCLSKDMCTELCNQSHKHGCLELCSGYLDAPDELRHQLYLVCDPGERISSKELCEPAVLSGIFNRALHTSLSVPQQVRLALQLVEAVLQFQSTPWLQSIWSLQDLSYFPDGDDLARSLRTLHISTDLSTTKSRASKVDTIMAGVGQSSEDLVDAQLSSGIRNLTMYSLGVALLQIGKWTPLDPGNVLEIRKLAARDSHIGPKFQEITLKVLECDFGFGTDLRAQKLQAAIYEDVVCELESLLEKLEGEKADTTYV